MHCLFEQTRASVQLLAASHQQPNAAEAHPCSRAGLVLRAWWSPLAASAVPSRVCLVSRQSSIEACVLVDSGVGVPCGTRPVRPHRGGAADMRDSGVELVQPSTPNFDRSSETNSPPVIPAFDEICTTSPERWSRIQGTGEVRPRARTGLLDLCPEPSDDLLEEPA